MPSMSERLNKHPRLSRDSQRILSAVHMVYRLVNSTYNVNELCLRLTRLVCQFIKANYASLMLLDSSKKKVVLNAIFNNKINILQDKRIDTKQLSPKERRITEGYVVFEKHLIGLPLVADDILGAILVRRKRSQKSFQTFDKVMLSVFAEQSVTAIKNLHLYEQQQKTILSSIKFIDQFLDMRAPKNMAHTPAYFNIVRSLAEKLNMNQEKIDCLYYASILHDAGSIDVPFEILSKNSQLTAEEFKIIRDMPSKSAALIKPVEFLRPVLPIILSHHEKYDGTGYPSGLKKEQIPLGARILAVVDAFEAMIRGRPYRRRLTITQALKELSDNSGTQFDPKVIKCFQELCQQKKFRNHLRRMK